LKPKILQVTNFLTYAGSHGIDFTGIQAAVIGGPNGAGKSSFFISAIEFALFGNSRDVPNEELICDGYDSCSVTFVFFHNDKTYAAKRSLTRGKTQTLQLFAFEPGKEDEGTDLSDRLLKNTQATLLDVIGFSQDLLFCTAISPQDEVNKLSLITASEREAILSEMLNLGIWEKKKKRVGDLINEKGDVLKQCEEVGLAIDVLIGNMAERKEKIQQLRIDAATAQNAYDQLYSQFEQLQKQFLAREERLKQKQALFEQITVLNTEIQTLKLNIEKTVVGDPAQIRERVDVVDQDLAECHELVKQIDGQMQTVRDNIKAWTDKHIEIRTMRGQETKLGILNEVPCKGMDIHRSCPLLKDAQDTKNRIDRYLSGQQNAAYSLQQADEHAANQEKEWTKKYHTFNDSKVQLQGRMSNLERQKEQLSGSLTLAEDVKRWRNAVGTKEITLQQKQSDHDSINIQWDNTQYGALQDQCTHASRAVGHYKAELAGEEQSLRHDQDAVGELESKLNALAPQRAEIENYKILQQAYSDIPTLLFTNTIPYVEAYANEFLMRISADRRIYLRAYRDTKAGTQRKALDAIGTTSTGSRSFKVLSGSEKFRESLALRLALSKVNAELYNTQIGFFIIDEGFGSLDEINVLLIKNALREAAKGFELFLVISHVPELADTFSKRILIRPFGKGKRVEVLENAATANVALDI